MNEKDNEAAEGGVEERTKNTEGKEVPCHASCYSSY